MLFKDIKIIDEDYKVQEHMYVQTSGTDIVYIGKECPETAADEEVYDGSSKLLMPGLYNLHCHVPMVALRGYGDGLPLQRWLNERIFPFEAKLTDEDIYWFTKLGAMELMSAGCVSISDMYFSINHMARALDESGMKANICHGISSFDDTVKLEELKGYKDTLELLEAVKEGSYGATLADGSDSRIKADMGLHAEYTSNENLVRQIAAAAKELGLIVHTHISETESEHEECKQRHDGLTPVQYMHKFGIFDNHVNAAHCVYLEPEDIELMRAAGASAVHNPSSNLKLGSGIARIKDYRQAGLNITLGTDGASSNNNLDMIEEMHMAAMLARGISQDANAISPEDVLRMAGYEGAKAQGRDKCGKIAEGWRADLVVINLDTPNMQPGINPISDLVFSAQSSNVLLTMADGRVIYKDGEYKLVDKERVFAEVKQRYERIVGELG